jgi:hypothetical protein
MARHATELSSATRFADELRARRQERVGQRRSISMSPFGRTDLDVSKFPSNAGWSALHRDINLRCDLQRHERTKVVHDNALSGWA